MGLEYYQFEVLLLILADRKLMALSTKNTLSLTESLLVFFQSMLFYFLIVSLVSLAMAVEDLQDINQCAYAALKQYHKRKIYFRLR